jgi:DNA-binding XRE family transcriptional regulator
MTKTLAEAVKDFRKNELGMSLSAFAKKSGISKPTLCSIEAGRRKPSLGTYRKLAETMGLPVRAVMELQNGIPKD